MRPPVRVKKIPTLFKRSEDRRYVIDEVTPGCEWVLAGEGVATQKYDGTCVMLDDDGQWWARREVKPGKDHPAGFLLTSIDSVTGKGLGWEPIENTGFAKYHAEALVTSGGGLPPGTYELCGPKINSNPEGFAGHSLVSHYRPNAEAMTATPRDFEGLQEWMRVAPLEGIVWQHDDGRMAKLKARDFPAGRRPPA